MTTNNNNHQIFCNTFATNGELVSAFNDAKIKVANDFHSYLMDIYGDMFNDFLNGDCAWGASADFGADNFMDMAKSMGIRTTDDYGTLSVDMVVANCAEKYLRDIYDYDLVDYLVAEYGYMFPSFDDIADLIPNTDGDLIWAGTPDEVYDAMDEFYAAYYG